MTHVGFRSEGRSAKIRQQLDHPVIDCDGHVIEFFPALFDYLKLIAGPEMVQRMRANFGAGGLNRWYELSAQERRAKHVMRPPFWQAPSENTLDRATAMLPRLMRERMDSFGIDYAIMYPTIGFLLPDIRDDEVRRAACRAYNAMAADLFADCRDRLTPAAVIPCHTPQEAIDELDYAVTTLGLKVVMLGTLVRRPLEGVTTKDPDIEKGLFWVDTLAIDSPYDYDPVWQKCIDLKVAATSHAVSQGIGMRRSISNYMYNQTGHFADASHAFAKALFFGGVTHRFPDLNFAFLECGVAWGCSLLGDLKERWTKRNRAAVQQFNPARIDSAKLNEYFQAYGGEKMSRFMAGAAPGASGRPSRDLTLGNLDTDETIDDFKAAGIESIDDLYDRFVPNFYYGCEADDPMTSVAFNAKALPFNTKLKAMFSSDLGHWDVPDMLEVLAEAHEMVENDLIGDDDFRDFVFTNPARLHVDMNPDFFKGTIVEDAVAKEVG